MVVCVLLKSNSLVCCLAAPGDPEAHNDVWSPNQSTDKYYCKSNVILCEDDCIISDPISVARLFNEYYTGIVDGIGFKVMIPFQMTI